MDFSKWVLWKDRDKLEGIKYPGIYVIALSEDGSIKDQDFDWIEPIIYIGMTNSKAGLKGRLKQFDNTIDGNRGHGGADRVKYAYPDEDKLIPKLYVSICYFECDVKSNKPEDLRTMGEVAKAEYDCFAEYRSRYGVLPTFNYKDSKIAPKYSQEVKKGNIKP